MMNDLVSDFMKNSALADKLKIVKVNGIVGSLLESSDELIVLTHGLMDNRMQYPILELSVNLYNLGFSTFRFDFRGCGESFYPPEVYSIRSMVTDIKEVIEYFSRKFNRIYLIAKSISTIPILLLKPNVENVIFLAIPFNIHNQVSKEEIELAEKNGYIFYEGRKYGYNLIRDYLEIGPKVPKLIKEFDIKSLAIYGSKDPYLEEAKKVLPTEYIGLEIIQKVGHSYREREEALEELTNKVYKFIRASD